MAVDDWYDSMAAGLFNYSPPMKKASIGDIRPFGPYKDSSGQWQFSLGMRIRTQANAPATERQLLAVCTGDVQFVPGNSPTAPGEVVLTAGDPLGQSVARDLGAFPVWFPRVETITYTNVNAASARDVAKKLLAESSTCQVAAKLVRQEYKDFDPPKGTLPAELLKIWLTGKWQNKPPDDATRTRIWLNLTVRGGDSVGECAAASDGIHWESELRFAPRTPTGVRLNPAYYFAQWQDIGWLKEADVLPVMTDMSGPPQATGRLLYVSALAGTTGGPFTTAAAPSKTISAAVAVAQKGDTILIVDQATYTEAVVINQPLSIISAGTKSPFDTAPDLPVLDGEDQWRPLTFQSIAGGVAHVGKIIIKKGRATNPREDGGGILVDKTDQVVVSACRITQCQARGDWIFAEGFGGGIAAYHASPAIVSCLIDANHAGGRGSGIGIFGYGWPSIFRCTIKWNSATTNPTAHNRRPDGGGIAVQIGVAKSEETNDFVNSTKNTLGTSFSASSLLRAAANQVRIMATTISDNVAYDDGGGLYITCSSRVLARGTTIKSNNAMHDGGGVRVSMNSELRMVACHVLANHSNSAKSVDDDAKYGGGGLSCRNARLVQLNNTEVAGNIANGWAGGGLYFLSTDEGEIEIPLRGDPDYDWNDVLLAVYKFDKARLHVDAACRFKNNDATFIVGQSGHHGKGGAIYVLRWQGNRRDTDVIPAGIVGQPIQIDVAGVIALETNNKADLPTSKRLYLEDQVQKTGSASTIRADADLPPTGPFKYP